MKLIYCLMILLCPYPGKSQPGTRLQPLTVGDRVPGITFKHILNTHYTSASLSSFTNKLVLVDFWATWCSACIREFPKLDSLQTHFKDRLQVLLVSSSTSDDVKGIQLFFKKHYNPAGKKYALTAVVNDVQMATLFPHISLPHIVWIYKSKVIAITDGEEITAANIEAVLDGEPVKLELKGAPQSYATRAERAPGSALRQCAAAVCCVSVLRQCAASGFEPATVRPPSHEPPSGC